MGFVGCADFSLRLRGDISSPRAGFSRRRHFFSPRTIPYRAGFDMLVCMFIFQVVMLIAKEIAIANRAGVEVSISSCWVSLAFEAIFIL
ncbi:hypothetical protein BHE74_00037301 [Ensete ventricosum]|nr:hypothetical protein BHE74_00037301 [Ensete ventricosum]